MMSINNDKNNPKFKDCLLSNDKEYGVIPGTDTMRCVGKVLGKI